MQLWNKLSGSKKPAQPEPVGGPAYALFTRAPKRINLERGAEDPLEADHEVSGDRPESLHPRPSAVEDVTDVFDLEPKTAQEPARKDSAEHESGGAPRLTSWLGAVKRRGQPQAARAEKGAASPFGNKTAATERVICTQLTDGTLLWWLLTKQGISQCEEPKSGAAVTFCQDDYRFASTKKLTFKAANDLAVSEAADYCAVLNLSGGSWGAVYATQRTRAEQASCALHPGSAVLSRLLSAKFKDRPEFGESDSIVGFAFPNEGRTASLVVLYKLTSDRQLTHPQVTVNAEDIGFVVRHFAQAARVNTDDAPVLLFTPDEFLSAAVHVPAYPSEPVWQGVPVRKAVQAVALVAGVGAAASVAFLAQQYLEQQSLASRQAALSAQVKSLDKQASDLIEASVQQFAQQQSLNPASLFNTASELWKPGAVVVLNADMASANIRYDVRMRLQQGQSGNSLPSVAAALSVDKLNALVDASSPAGCTRDATSITGNLNEIQVVVNCQVPADALRRYRLN